MYPAGQIFLRLLFMTVVPIVFVSITLGVAGIGDMKTLGRLGGRTFGYFALSTLIAATIGLTLVNFIKPGEGLDEATRSDLMERFSGGAESMTASGPPEFGINTFVNIIPRNPIAAAAEAATLDGVAKRASKHLRLVPIEQKPAAKSAPAKPEAAGVAVARDYAFVALGVGGLDVFDISDPANPVRLDAEIVFDHPAGTLDKPRRPDGVAPVASHVDLVIGHADIKDTGGQRHIVVHIQGIRQGDRAGCVDLDVVEGLGDEAVHRSGAVKDHNTGLLGERASG